VLGCGLGLAIVQHIAKLHNAKITLAKSTQLNGLKVSVKFPIKAQSVNVSISNSEMD
jgi:two-component system sensor histidine kinase QseC